MIVFTITPAYTLYTLHLTLYTPYAPQGLPHGFLYHAIRLLRLVNIVERYLVLPFPQQPLIQSIRLAHQTAQAVAMYRTLEERLRRPAQHLSLVCRQIGHTHRPCHKTLAMTIQVVYRYLTTQFLGFGKSIFQPSC